ncbi:MAG TPA: MFS transporter [Gemmatimonadaceae bacterium]|nr:MFS transporter [Gemmatimonadaceae bacterium]
MDDSRLQPHDPYASLRIPSYRWYILSTFTMTLAAQIQGVVVSWQIYDITRDPLSLGLMGLAEALPYISIALFAGHVADRQDRRTISLGSLALLVVCSISLLSLSLGASWRGIAGGHRVVWPFYVIIFLSGIARSFLQPARQALGAEIVPRSLFPNAVAWRSSTWQTAAVAGPALGGLLYGFTSPSFAYGVDVMLMIFALLAFAAIAYVPRGTRTLESSVGESLRTGIQFVFGEPVLLGAMTLDLFSVLLGGAEALLPVFADSILKVGPEGLGILRAAPAAGATVMSIYLAHRRPFQRAGRALLNAVALFALCIIGFGLSRSFFFSLVLLAISGMADNVSVVVRSTLLQVMTPEHLFGRVSSVNAIFIGSSNELGAFESGVAARLLGTVTSVVLGGVASLSVVGIVALRIPSLRRLGAIDRIRPAS